jgi:hypothetical protein
MRRAEHGTNVREMINLCRILVQKSGGPLQRPRSGFGNNIKV